MTHSRTMEGSPALPKASISALSSNESVPEDNEEHKERPSALEQSKVFSGAHRLFTAEKDQKVEVISVLQRQWKAFEIGKDQPYKIYQAWPLITCSAYLFQYRKPDDQEMAILYHASAGIPHELAQVIERIKQDGVDDLKKVTLIVASSDNADDKYNQPAIKTVLKIRNEIFNENDFPEENCTVMNNRFSQYAVDTRGNHGLRIQLEIVVKELYSSPPLSLSPKTF